MINLVPNIYAHYKLNDNDSTPFVDDQNANAVNLVTNSNCDSDTGWTKTLFAFNASGFYYEDSAGLPPPLAPELYQTIASLSNGTTYRLYYVVAGVAAVFQGSITPSVGGANGTTVTAVGSYIEDIVCGANTTFKFTGGTGAAQKYSVDNIYLFKLSDYPNTAFINPTTVGSSAHLSSACTSAGVINNCLSMFSGTTGSLRVIAEVSFANFTDEDFTFVIWIWHDVTSSDYVFFKGTATVEGYYLLVNSANKLYFVSTAEDATQDITYSVESVATGEWEHIAVVRDGTDVRLYLNGTECTYTVDGTHVKFQSSAQWFGVGASTVDTAARWDGKIDDFRIYDRVLTLAEIQWIYNGNAGTESQSTIPFIHHYKQVGGY